MREFLSKHSLHPFNICTIKRIDEILKLECQRQKKKMRLMSPKIHKKRKPIKIGMLKFDILLKRAYFL